MKPFSDIINSLRYGHLSEELTRQLHQLTLDCQAAGRPGTLTLNITLKPGKAGQMEVVDDVKVKPPKPERGTSLMFATDDGALVREDPRQKKLDLRQVDPETGEIRNVPAAPTTAAA